MVLHWPNCSLMRYVQLNFLLSFLLFASWGLLISFPCSNACLYRPFVSLRLQTSHRKKGVLWDRIESKKMHLALCFQHDLFPQCSSIWSQMNFASSLTSLEELKAWNTTTFMNADDRLHLSTYQSNILLSAHLCDLFCNTLSAKRKDDFFDSIVCGLETNLKSFWKCVFCRFQARFIHLKRVDASS